jgi:hypothetical protein
MNWSRVFALAFVVVGSLSPVRAQEPARLLFEITKNSSLIGKPELRVASGGEGLIVLSDEYATNPRLAGLRERITVSPTVRADDIAIAFNITSNGKQFRPSLVISDAVRGSLEWTSSDGQPVRLTVTWVR